MTEYVIKKPFGIAVLMAILGFLGSLGPVAVLCILAISIFDDGPYRMNDEVVTKTEFLRFLVPFTAVYLAVCGLAFVIAWSIHSEHPRSRPLLLAFSALPLVTTPLLLLSDYPLGGAAGFVMPLVIPLLAWLYLYRRQSVSQYYGTLAHRSDVE